MAEHGVKTPEKAETKAPEPTRAEKIAQLKRLQDDLRRTEATTGSSGAIPNTPKGMLLDARDIEAQHPDKRLRWVNVKNEDKAQMRQAMGYERVPLTEGGKQVGNLALFALNRDVYDARVADIKQRTKERLTAHKAEVEEMAESVARVLRDKHGVNVNPEDFLIRG